MDKEREQFHADLLQSVREMKLRNAARVTRLELTEAAVARAKVGMSQSEFADLLGVSVRTHQQWEQGSLKPTSAAKTLLRVAMRYPGALKDI